MLYFQRVADRMYTSLLVSTTSINIRDILTRLSVDPLFLNAVPPSTATAAPKLCPVRTSRYPEYVDCADLIRATRSSATVSQDSKKPEWASQSLHKELASVKPKLIFAIQLLMDRLPRKETTRSLLVLSTARKPATLPYEQALINRISERPLGISQIHTCQTPTGLLYQQTVRRDSFLPRKRAHHQLN